MNLARSGLKRRSASTTDCFRAPVSAGYVRLDEGSDSASTYLSSFSLVGPPLLVWAAILCKRDFCYFIAANKVLM